MSSEDEATERYGAELAGKLVACGVSASAISVRYEDVIRDYEIVISCGPLSRVQIECIEAALYPEGWLQFTDSINTTAYQQVQSRRYRRSLMEQADGMPGLPHFDPATTTVERFARELEIWCDVEPGKGLEVIDGQLSVIRASLPLKPEDMRRMTRLMKAMAVALRNHDGVIRGVIGGT